MINTPEWLAKFLHEWQATDQPIEQRGGVLPLGVYQDGSVHLAWPEMSGIPAWNRLQDMGSPDITSDPEGVATMAGDAFNVAGAAAFGGFAAPRPRNALAANEAPRGIKANGVGDSGTEFSKGLSLEGGRGEFVPKSGSAMAARLSRLFESDPEARYVLDQEVARRKAGGHTPFRYEILDQSGLPQGIAKGSVIGNTMYFDWFGGSLAKPTELGLSGVRQLREQVRKDFPDVTNFTGFRVSGAKKRTDNPTQAVHIDANPYTAVPLGLAPDAFDEDPRQQTQWNALARPRAR